MAKRVLPFLVQPKEEIRAIGTPEIGIIHLKAIGGISPNENPVDLQEAGTRQAKVQLLLQQAIKRLSEEKKISKAEARKQLFEAPAVEAAPDEDMPSLYDHLSPEESAELLSLREDTASIAIRAATLFIRYRVAYPVQVVGVAKAKGTTIVVAPTSFPIADGQKIKFGSTKVEVDGYHEAGAEELKVQPLSGPIAAEKIGYLCDLETGRVAIGDAEWTEEDTREALTEDLILAIYSFYQVEMSGAPEDKEEPALEGNENLALSSSAA